MTEPEPTRSADGAPTAERRLVVPLVTSSAPAAIELPQEVLDDAPVGMVLLDPTASVLWANRSAGRILGVAPGQLVQRAASSLDDAPELWSLLPAFRSVLGGKTQRWEGEIRLKVGGDRSIWLQLSLSAAPPGAATRSHTGQGAAVICQFIDITGRKLTEAQLAATREELERRNAELERSNEDLSQFAYVASHDLSEPLRVIAGHVELLAGRYGDRLDDDAVRWIDFAVDGCNRMRAMIDDLLLYARAGRDTTVREETDLGWLVRQTIRDLAPAITEAGADIEVTDLPVVRANPGQLRQVFANLLANAVKFARPGTPPLVRVLTRRQPTEWHVGVVDNGIGIPEEYRSRVFGIFQRLHSREEYQGSGIGLAMVRKLVGLHGGRVWIDTAPGGGTAIWFSLPDDKRGAQ